MVPDIRCALIPPLALLVLSAVLLPWPRASLRLPSRTSLPWRRLYPSPRAKYRDSPTAPGSLTGCEVSGRS